MKPIPDDSAQAILQYVQDEYKCCGFGNRKDCVADSTLADWLIDSKQPKQRCSQYASQEVKYCSYVQILE